jgi:hypothetical protein
MEDFSSVSTRVRSRGEHAGGYQYLEEYEVATDTFLVIEKFSYEGIRRVVFGNAVRPDISTAGATSCGSASSRSHADQLRLVLLDQQLHMALVQDRFSVAPDVYLQPA